MLLDLNQSPSISIILLEVLRILEAIWYHDSAVLDWVQGFSDSWVVVFVEKKIFDLLAPLFFGPNYFLSSRGDPFVELGFSGA